MLANCEYLNDQILEIICSSCLNIIQLDLQSCQNIIKFSSLINLTKLQNLNLYRTNIFREELVDIIAACNKILYLNLGSCLNIDRLNFVLNVIATHQKHIRGLNLWRAYSLTYEGIEILAQNCHDLEEIDFGWGSKQLIQPLSCIHSLVKNCPRLKTLFMPGVRVSDDEVNVVAKYSKEIEQFDILGSSSISFEAVEK